jgi:predicted transcriptional regulator of viral defense system
MARDLGEAVGAYRKARFPLPCKPAFHRIAGTAVQVLDRSRQGAFKMIKGTPLRVATVGRTFLDMLREPLDCGGMQHVLDIYRTSAPRYLTLIVDEVDRNGTGIDKVRAGYVLTDLCGLAHPSIEDWERFGQRGGSRKLDPNAEYASDFSKRWKLSLNVPSLQPLPGQHE